MTKEELLYLLGKILNTDANLGFLLALETKDLETLIACIRDRIEREKKEPSLPGILH